MSEQHAGEGAGRITYFSQVFTEQSFPASHVASMMASRGVLCSYEILNLLGPRVWTDHLQASVPCGEPRRAPEISCPSTTHTLVHILSRNTSANVPAQDKLAGLRMLTQIDNKKYRGHGNAQTYTRHICRLCSLFSLECFLHDTSLVSD